MISQKASKLKIHIVLLTVLAIVLVPEVAWANGMGKLVLYFMFFPLYFFLIVSIKLLFIKAFEIPVTNVVHFFSEFIFIFISYHVGLHISIYLFDVFAPHYYLAFYCSASLVYMMMAWPFNVNMIKKISPYRHSKAFMLSALFPLIFFSIILTGLPPASWWENEVFEKRISKPITAEDFYLRGHKVEGEAAIATYTRAIELDPKNDWYYSFRGDVYLKENQFEEAISDFTKAIELNPLHHRYLVTRAEAYYQKGDYDKAIADIDTYLTYWRFDGEAFYIRGEAYKQKGNLDQAIADFSEALRLGANTKHFQAINARADAYKQKGNLDQAIADFSMALRIGGVTERFQLLYSRAEAYYLIKDFDRAWRDVHDAERYGQVSREFLDKLRRDSGRDK